jgi:hypothetical protein
LAADWLNENQGVVGVVLFVVTALLGWSSGIFRALRQKPSFAIRIIEGPTFACTFGIAKQHGNYQVHRTGIVLYLDIANVGSSPSSIREINVAYHWALAPFSKLWLKYALGWFWLRFQTVCIDDFQVEIGDRTKFYPFLTQRSSTSGASADTYLDIGKSAVGIVYFEQPDSWGGCFPVSIASKVKVKVAVEDAFGRWHSNKFWIPKLTLAEAKKFNPSFGQTLSSLHVEEEPFELPVDNHGNIIPPEPPFSPVQAKN